MSRVAVVTIAHGRHDHLDLQHESLARGATLPDDYVVVAMDDPDLPARSVRGLDRHVVHVTGDARGLPLAKARNSGVRTARERGADLVVCLDVDCVVAPTTVAAYRDTVQRSPGTLWSGPVTYLDPPGPEGYDLARLAELDRPHPARPAPSAGTEVHDGDPDLFWSLSFACTTATWSLVDGFDEEYVGYGAEDTDFAHRAAAAGVRTGWVGSARAYHQWHPSEDPPVRHLRSIARNAALFRRRWGRWPMEGWLQAFEAQGLAERRGNTIVLIRQGDAISRRKRP